MNQNRPFFSTNTNLFDESFRSSAPTTLNGENVILSQEQQRRVCDTMNTSIVGNPFGPQMNQQNMLCAQKQYFPGGVLFTFPHSVQMGPQNLMQGTCCRCYPTPPAVAANTFFPSTMDYQPAKAFNGMTYQQSPPREPFQLRFHHDRGTSSSDLLRHFSQVPASKGLPDLSNINGVLQCLQQPEDSSETGCQSYLQALFPSPPIEFSSNAKKLVLSKPVAIANGHVVDVLDENKKTECDKKKVSFSDPNTNLPSTEERGAQITSECICDEKTCKNKSELNKNEEKGVGDDMYIRDKPKKQKPKKTKNKKDIHSDSSETTQSYSDSDDISDKKSKKKHWWGEHKKKTEQVDSDTTHSSDDENCDKKHNKKRKNKKRKTKGESKDSLEHKAPSDSSDQSDSASEPSRSD